MAESNKKDLGDDFQQRPTDTEAEGQQQGQQIPGQIGITFDRDGSVEHIELKRGDLTRPHETIRIIEHETNPGEYHGMVLYSTDGRKVQTEIKGKPVDVPCYDGVSGYTRYDPAAQQRPTDDTGTGDAADGEPPAIVIDVDPDDPERDVTPRDVDAFMRRQDKSLAQAARAAMENALMYNSAIARALSESTLFLSDVMRDTIAPAINEAARVAVQAAREITPAIQAAAEKSAQMMKNIPVIDPDTLRLIGDAMRKWARENVILLTMAQHWKDINGVDLLDDDDPIEADAPDAEADAEAEGNSLIEALRILATAYSETHGGIDAIISDDGTTFDLPPEAEADINALIDEYSAFHSSSGAESYVVTAQIFAKGHFHTTDTHDIIISDRITAISLRDFQFALTTRPNPTAFIAPLGTGAFTRFRYDDATGQVINVKTGQPVQETQTPAETASMMKTQADTVTTPDFVLLTALYSVLLRNAERFEGDNIIVPIKPFARELGVDLGGGIGHVKDLEKRFQVYDPYVGWINGQGLFAVLKFIKRDDTNGTMTFSAPYLNRLLTLVQQRGTRTFKSGRKTFLGHNELVHTSIYKERNQTAAAIVIHICDLLLQNAQQPDRKKGETHVISHIAFSTLADYAEFAPRIERTTATREKTRMLKACFTKALELLRTRSDAYQYFDGLELYTLGKDGKTKTFATVKGKNGELLDNLTGGKEKYNAIAPTFAGYKGNLYIRHRGADKNWKHGE